MLATEPRSGRAANISVDGGQGPQRRGRDGRVDSAHPPRRGGVRPLGSRADARPALRDRRRHPAAGRDRRRTPDRGRGDLAGRAAGRRHRLRRPVPESDRCDADRERHRGGVDVRRAARRRARRRRHRGADRDQLRRGDVRGVRDADLSRRADVPADGGRGRGTAGRPGPRTGPGGTGVHRRPARDRAGAGGVANRAAASATDGDRPRVPRARVLGHRHVRRRRPRTGLPSAAGSP